MPPRPQGRVLRVTRPHHDDAVLPTRLRGKVFKRALWQVGGVHVGPRLQTSSPLAGNPDNAWIVNFNNGNVNNNNRNNNHVRLVR